MRTYRADGSLAQFWDNATRTYFEYNTQGVQTLSRPYNAKENVAAAAEALLATMYTNRATAETKARQAATANKTYLAIGAPVNADVIAQVRALTKQVNGIVKFIFGDFSDITDI